jgi:hypothetical protein
MARSSARLLAVARVSGKRQNDKCHDKIAKGNLFDKKEIREEYLSNY